MDRCDIRMIERRQQLRFAPEAAQSIRIECEQRRQDFECDITTERRIARALHVTHTARADSFEYLVGTEATTAQCLNRRQLSGELDGGTFEQTVRRVVVREQRLHLPSHAAVRTAVFGEKTRAVFVAQFARTVIDVLDLFPPIHVALRFCVGVSLPLAQGSDKGARSILPSLMGATGKL
jgi:hypothetical protein